MNRKAQLDEFNFAYVGLAILAGLIGFFVSSRVPDVSKVLSIITGLLSVVAAYAYLILTDR
jgi:hypothetical protein|tara:strand:- start:4600 stop:4782 length:183 start_codon:yes stop_codon:yes gene_type:complete